MKHGETFVHNGTVLMAIDSDYSCDGCYLEDDSNGCEGTPVCSGAIFTPVSDTFSTLGNATITATDTHLRVETVILRKDQTEEFIAMLRSARGDIKDIKTEWIKAKTPPEMTICDFGWLSSTKVLVCEIDGEMRVATYEQIDEDSDPCWYSACSERWKLDRVTHWMSLPEVA